MLVSGPGQGLSSFRPHPRSGASRTLSPAGPVWPGQRLGELRTEGQPKIVLKSETQNVKSIILLQIYSKHEPKIYLSH